MKHAPSDRARHFAAEEARLAGVTPSQRPENTGAILATAVEVLSQAFRQWLVDAKPSEDVARRAAEKVFARLQKDAEEFRTPPNHANNETAHG